MTSRKFSCKRIGQALGLVALGLVLLVGSAEYGRADYEQIGTTPLIMATVQQETAVIIVRGVVKANGELQVKLPLPGAELYVKSVVDASQNPPKPVPAGTQVLIEGFAKPGVSAFTSLEDLDFAYFSATVSSSALALGVQAQERHLGALVRSFTQTKSGRTTIISPAGDGSIFMNLAGILSSAFFGCCEIRMTIDREKGPKTDETMTFTYEDKDKGGQVIWIMFTIFFKWECEANPFARFCKGEFDVLVREQPQQITPHGKVGPTLDWNIVLGFYAERKSCQDKGPHDGKVRVIYRARFPSAHPSTVIQGPLILHFFIEDKAKSRVNAIDHVLIGNFRIAGGANGKFPVTWRWD